MEACGAILECERGVCYFGLKNYVTREVIDVVLESIKGSTFSIVFSILISAKVCVTFCLLYRTAFFLC